MTIEKAIKDVINQKMNDGTVEALVAEQLEKGVKNALENLFRSYGDVTKIIEDKVKSVMVPFLENYDYSEYITKLDSVLVEVLQKSALENKQLLKNFKVLIEENDEQKSIKVTELFDKWMTYVEKNVKTDGLEVCIEDDVRYETVEVRFEVDYGETESWRIYEYATIIFECEHDEEMNFAVRLHRYKKDSNKGWDIEYDRISDLRTLRHINDFELLLMKLHQNNTKIVIDSDCDSNGVQPEEEPEATFS